MRDLLRCFMFLVLLTGCGSATIPTASIVGSWSRTVGTGSENFTFAADGTYTKTLKAPSMSDTVTQGTYTVSGENLEERSSGTVIGYTYSVSSTTLTVSEGSSTFTYLRGS